MSTTGPAPPRDFRNLIWNFGSVAASMTAGSQRPDLTGSERLSAAEASWAGGGNIHPKRLQPLPAGAAVPPSAQRRRKTDRIPTPEPRLNGIPPGWLGAWSSLKHVISRTNS